MKSLGSADELFKHYQAVHDAGNDSGHGGEASLALTRYNMLVRNVILSWNAHVI